MALHLLLLIAAASFAAQAACARTFTLTAEPGESTVETVDDVSPQGMSVSIRMLRFDGTNASPTAVYAGFCEDADRNNTVYFRMVRNREDDGYLAATYGGIQSGRKIWSFGLGPFPEHVPLDATVRVILRFHPKGTATLSFEEILPEAKASPRKRDTHVTWVGTPFTQVAPCFSVSSGSAEFTVDPYP